MTYVCTCSVASVESNSLQPCGLYPPGSLVMGFSRQEYWSGLPCPAPGNLPHPGIKPVSKELQAYSLVLSLQGSPIMIYISLII